MLAMRVRFGEVVVVGGLSVSATRTGAASVCLVVTDESGTARYLTPPVRDILPGVTIDASRATKNMAKIAIEAPMSVLISRKAQHIEGD